MEWIRTVRKTALYEVALVLLATALATYVTVTMQMTDRIGLLEGQPGQGTDLADFGPGLLVLSSGLGIMAYRRWTESEQQRALYEDSTSARLRSEERYRALVEVAPDPVVVVGDMKIVYVNPAGVSFFGAGDASELLGRGVLDFVPPADAADAVAWLGGVLLDGDRREPVELALLRLDGTTVDAEIALARTPYEGGFALQAVVRDLSSRHQAAEALARYEALSENTQDSLLFASPDGRIIDCNRAAIVRYGYTKDELSSMSVHDLRAPGTELPSSVDLTSALGDTARFDQTHRCKDGGLVELSVTAQRMLVGGKEVIVSIGRDVTEKRRANRELRASEARYRSLIELSPAPVLVYDFERVIVFANAAALDLVRARNASEVVGRNAKDFVLAEDRKAGEDSRALLERDGTTPFEDMTLMRIDGTSVAVQVATSKTTYEGVDAYHAVLQDVSQLMGVADNLRRTTEGTIAAMARLAECRDPYTSGHQERVAEIASRIAERMGLSQSSRDAVRFAGLVHDIGKMGVPTEILSKPGHLTEPEFSLIKEHAQRGYDLLAPIDFPWPIAEIVREHHERPDGSGYPRGLMGADICIEARVIAVADTVEAISSDRPYRPALGIDHALGVIRDARGTHYDETCVDAALELAAEGCLLEGPEAVRETRALAAVV